MISNRNHRLRRSAQQARTVTVLFLCCALALPLASYAQDCYTDKDAFLAALLAGSLVVVNDWESDSAGAFVPSGTSICQGTLTYDLPDGNGEPLKLQLLDFFDTTTPTNYVGPESIDPRYALFLSGDSVTLTVTV